MKPNGKRRRVLIVDDQPEWLKLVELWLRDMGYHVEIATDGAEASLKLFDQPSNPPYDVVFLDLYLPKINGFQILKRAAKEKPELPIVVITASADTLLGRDAVGLGYVDLIEKHKLLDLQELKRLLDNSEN